MVGDGRLPVYEAQAKALEVVRTTAMFLRDERRLGWHCALAGAETTHGAGFGSSDLGTGPGHRGRCVPAGDRRDLHFPISTLRRISPLGLLVMAGRVWANGRVLCSQHERQAGQAGPGHGPDGVLDCEGCLHGWSTP